MNSLKFLHRENDMDSKFEKWIKYLDYEENKAIVSDLFWYSICKFFNPNKYIDTQNLYLKRIAKNYINYFLSITDKHDNHLFFKTYFDILA